MDSSSKKYKLHGEACRKSEMDASLATTTSKKTDAMSVKPRVITRKSQQFSKSMLQEDN